jgi:hypothetical protein
MTVEERIQNALHALEWVRFLIGTHPVVVVPVPGLPIRTAAIALIDEHVRRAITLLDVGRLQRVEGESR